MVITDTPRSLAMSFIRVLMIVIQYIEPQAAIPVYDDFSERAQRPFPKLRGPRFLGIPLAERCLPVDIDNFTDYCPFLSTDPPRSCPGELRETDRKTRDFRSRNDEESG